MNDQQGSPESFHASPEEAQHAKEEEFLRWQLRRRRRAG
jgi:hypothetical protein